ncbi:MAG: hypothetical protein RR914_02390 [Oscillospiraceae bacterium]
MERFEIARLIVEMNANSEILYNRTRPYLTDKKSPTDISINIKDEVFVKKHEHFPQLTLDECRYMWTGEAFYQHLLDFNGLLLHASCVSKGDFAYLFSAKSGTGKSTHTHLWLETFDDAKIINDDKPAIRKIDGKFMASGTPFSGKNDESLNIQVPIRAIIFLERATKNKISPMNAQNAIPLFLSQTIRPNNAVYMSKMLSLLDEVLKEIPIFKLECNISKEAAETAFEFIEKYIEGENL